MKTEEAVLASQTRLMLGQAEAMTTGQGKDRLGNYLKEHGLKPIVQAWLNNAGLRMVGYSIRSDVCNESAPAGLSCPGSRAPSCGRARETPVTLRLGSGRAVGPEPVPWCHRERKPGGLLSRPGVDSGVPAVSLPAQLSDCSRFV